ncbi:hypothetical protein F0562_010985 [Nyssa sinensis]|uniref:MADS-box domain-containing protein n=1 Tax=Nyssa sinensis TaxID=561372 RepID=A0A5J5A420_9ASTE|nr:hypothetical protein F0562_010985 [Nyssa sinensis]
MLMGRNKLTTKRIENPISRQVTYSKRKDGIVKKANELSVLCDTDVALIMFSPTGRLTNFASNGRVEDIFLRFINRPDELKGGPIWNEEYLSQRLKQLKHEAEMLEKMAKIEALEEELYKLNRRQREAQEKMRYYDPNKQSKAKLLGNKIGPQIPESIEVAALDTEDAYSITDESVGTSRKRDASSDEHHNVETCPGGPHLSLRFLKEQKP